MSLNPIISQAVQKTIADVLQIAELQQTAMPWALCTLEELRQLESQIWVETIS